MAHHKVAHPAARAVLLGSILAWTAAVAPADAGSLSFRTVALSGEPAPGTNETFDFVSLVVVDEQGQAALHALLTGNSDGPCDEFGDPVPDQGIWSEAGGVLDLVVRRGDSAPGADPLVTFNAFDAPVLNAAGQSALWATLTGTEADGDCANGDGNVGVWSQQVGVLGLVVLAGDAAPGTPDGVSFDNFANVRFNSAGQAAFSGFLAGAGVSPANSRGIWSEIDGLELVARSGSQAPGTNPGVVFDWFGSGSPVLNGSGQAAFRAALVGPGVDDTNSYGIWKGTPGSVSLAVRAGTPAPGAGAGTVFSWLGSPRLNDAGHLAFASALAGEGVNESNDLAVWSDAPGALTMVARTGSPAPGTGGSFTDLGDPVLNSAGQIAFRGFTGPGAGGIWSQGSGELALVAHVGDPAPGTEAGVTFAGFGHPALNGAGHSAFWAVLAGPGVSSTNDSGLWAQGPPGELSLVVREGDALDVPGEPGTTTWLTLIAGSAQGGGATGFNDTGQVAFQASFTDGSTGGFVASFCSLADLTGDCHVGIEDLLELLAAWGPCPAQGACPGDLDGDGQVGIVDLLTLLAEWSP